MGRDEDERTLFCGNLSENVTEALLYELFSQAGPLDRVHIPRKDNRQCSFAFVTYAHSCSIPYAIDVYAGTRLFDRDLRITARNQYNAANGVAANKAVAAAPKTFGLDAMGALRAGGFGNTSSVAASPPSFAIGALRTGGFGNTMMMAPPASFADDMRPRSPPAFSRGRQQPSGGGSGGGSAGETGLTPTELEIQRLLLMSAQMLHGAPQPQAPMQAPDHNYYGGANNNNGGGGGRSDYGEQNSHRRSAQRQHRRFDDSAPTFRSASHHSQHDDRASNEQPYHHNHRQQQNPQYDQRDHRDQRDQRGGDRRDRDRSSSSGRSSSGRQSQKPDRHRRWQ